MFVIFTSSYNRVFVKESKTKTFSSRKLKTVTPISTSLITGLLIYFLAVSQAFAQSTVVKDTTLEFHSLTTIDGLSQNSVHQIFQDEHGFMWFATEFGVDRYDGTFENSETFALGKSLRDNVSLFYENHKEESDILLVATEKNLYRINCHTGITDTIINAPEHIIFICTPNKDKKEEMLLFADSACYILNGSVSIRNTDTLYNLKLKINCVVELAPKIYLLGTSKGIVLYHYDRSKSRISTPIFGPPKNSNITHLTYSPFNNALYYVEDQDTASLLGSYQISEQFTLSQPKSFWSQGLSEIRTLFIDKQQQLWVGTRYKGLFFFDKNQAYKVNAANDKIDFSQHEILSIHQSEDSVIWVGTLGSGVLMVQKQKQHFEHHFSKEAANSGSNHTWSINTYDDYILVGTIKDGLAIIDRRSPSDTVHWILPLELEKKAHTIYSIVRGANCFFLGTENGIYKLLTSDLDQLKSNKTKSIFYSTLDSTFNEKRVPYLFYDKELSYLWVSQRESKDSAKLHILEVDQNYQCTSILKDFSKEFNGNRIDVIKKYYVKKKGGLPETYHFFIGWEKGLTIFTEDQMKAEEKILPIWDTTGIYAIYHIGDTIKNNDYSIWLGTDRKGLIQFDLDTEKTIIMGVTKGAPNDIIYAILSGSRKSQLWFSTNHGLGEYNLQTKTFNQYRILDNNLQSDEFNAGAYFFCKKTNTLFFGGINGITGLSPMPGEITPPSDKLVIYVQSPHAGIDTTLLFSSQTSTAYLDPIPRDFNTLSLIPCILNYQDPSNNQYKYCVNCKEGEEKWKYSTKSIELLTSDLELGTRGNEIKLRIRNSNSTWSPIFIIHSKVNFFSSTVVALLAAIISLLLLTLTFWLQKVFSNRLNVVHTKINDVSRLNNLDEICKDALRDFIKVFKMDYAIISLVDFNERKLIPRGYIHKNSQGVYWTNYNADSYYINIDKKNNANESLLKCINKNEYIPLAPSSADVHRLFYRKKEGKAAPPLTKRFFFPIIHRTKKQEVGDQQESKGGDLTMGVIEIGYQPGLSNIIKRLRFPFMSDRKRLNMKLYIDNFAQPYYRALLEEKKEELFEKTIDNNLEELNHDDFLKKFIQDLTRATKIDFGSIALKTFNFPRTNLVEKNIHAYRGKKKAIDLRKIDHSLLKDLQFGTHREGMMRYAIKRVKPSFSNDVQTLTKQNLYIGIHSDIKSEMAVPLIPGSLYKNAVDSSGYVIGALSLSSRTSDYFNKIQLESINALAQKATEEYLKIRSRWSLSQLTQPLNIFSEKVSPIYERIVNSLQGYFDSKYISIWEKDISHWEKDIASNFGIFRLAFKTPELEKPYHKQNMLYGSIEKNIHDSKDPLSFVKLVDDLKDGTGIKDFCKANQFQCYIVILIVIDGNYEAFINIFSKRILAKELRKDDQIFLDQIAEKTGMALQSTKMISSLKDISESLVEQNQAATLQRVVDSAVEVLHADLVSLFYYKSDKGFDVKNTFWSSNYSKKTKVSKKSRFADSIFKSGTKYIETVEEYTELLKRAPEHHPKIDLDDENYTHFWHDMKLKSVAAILIQFNNRKIGVMIFNFKSQKKFDQLGAKRFIEGFANLAKAAILNADFLEDIKLNIQTLKNENIELQTQKKDLVDAIDAITFEHDAVQKKMEALIPQSFRTSFYTIVEGTNHDIRNCLLDLQFNNINIRSNYDRLPPVEKKEIDESIKNIAYNIQIIENLLDLFDLKKRKKDYNNINDLIKKQIIYWEHRKPEIEFNSSKLDPIIPDLYCFKVDLSMIIFNLVNNAVYAVEKQERSQGRISFITEEKDGNILITVQDNGTGILKNNRSKIFKADFTTKEEGIGIGLYYVDQTLKKHFGGMINLVSAEKGQGTTFAINIPLNKELNDGIRD